MLRTYWLHFAAAFALAVAAVLLIRVHYADGATPASDGVEAGHKLAQAWCKSCHAIEATTAGTSNTAPDFAAIANMASTTTLSVKVFLQSSHRSMPNLVLTPEQMDDLASYIMSLRRS